MCESFIPRKGITRLEGMACSYVQDNAKLFSRVFKETCIKCLYTEKMFSRVADVHSGRRQYQAVPYRSQHILSPVQLFTMLDVVTH